MNLKNFALMIIVGIVCSFGCASQQKTNNSIFLDMYMSMEGNTHYYKWPAEEWNKKVADFQVKLPPGCFMLKSEKDEIRVYVVEVTEERGWFRLPYDDKTSFNVYSFGDRREINPYRDSTQFIEDIRAGATFPMSASKNCADVIAAFPEVTYEALAKAFP